MDNKIGRTIIYKTNEERLIAGRKYCKKYNDNHKFECVICNIRIHPASKFKHLKTIKHKKIND